MGRFLKTSGTILTLVATTYFASADVVSAAIDFPDSCNAGLKSMSIRDHVTAAAQFKTCYNEPDADNDIKIHAHYHRGRALMALDDASGAKAEFATLLVYPLSFSEVYSRSPNNDEAIGNTLSGVMTLLARIALVEKDLSEAIGYSEMALRKAPEEVEVTTDISGEAYHLRARARLAQDRKQPGRADIYRAYVRGNLDPFIIKAVAQIGSENIAKLDALKLRLASIYEPLGEIANADYLHFSMSKLMTAQADATAAYKAFVIDETRLIGPDDFDTKASKP